MCGCFCIGLIDFVFTGKKLTDFTNLFSPYDFEKNSSTILSYFKSNFIEAIDRTYKFNRSNKT